MIASVIAHPHLFWIALGGILLATEMLGSAGYLLWCGIAALLTGLLAWLLPLDWALQGSCFAVLTLVSAFLWYQWLRRRQLNSDTPVINQRGQQFIGKRFYLDNATINGKGSIRVGDSNWPITTDNDIPAGKEVMVTAIEGITLHVKQV